MITMCKKTVDRLVAVLMMLIVLSGLVIQPAKAAEKNKTYETFKEGTCCAEIGIVSENEISLDSEELILDYSHVKEPFGDLVTANTTANYILSNISSKEVYTSIAVPKLLKVKKVTINREEIESFESGESILVDGETVNGFIYVNSSMDKLRKDSVYETDREILSHVDYRVCFDEGFSMYAVTSEKESVNMESGESGAPLSDTVDYYVVSEDGELSLCSVIYNLKFIPGSSSVVTVTGSMSGEMSRATKYTEMGTTFSYSYVGENLESFYSVGDVKISFILPEGNILPLLECDAARYMENDVWTIHFKGSSSNFDFKLGEELTKEQINDIYTTFGPGKILINIVEVVTATVVVFSCYFLYYSVKKRKESGIGR